MQFRWLRVAVVEAREARRFYDLERDGLGAEFADELRTAISRLQSFPLAWPAVEPPVRRIAVNRFPYLLHYIVERDAITIVGVYHARRKPVSWRDRLNEDV